MSREDWRRLYRAARIVRKKGWTAGLRRLGSGIEKTAYEHPDFPGWVLKLGGGQLHAPEGAVYHKLPAELRPRTVFLPVEHLEHTGAVQIQERAQVYLSLCREKGYNGIAALRPLIAEVRTRLHDCGVGDIHPGNLGLVDGGSRVVCLDWALQVEATPSQRRQRYQQRKALREVWRTPNPFKRGHLHVHV